MNTQSISKEKTMKDKIYLCYYDYGGWDHCSHPVCFFLTKEEAEEWKKRYEGIFQEMELGKEYLPR